MAALGLTLALAWRAAAGEPCVGTSWGCSPKEGVEATGRLAHLSLAFVAKELRQPWDE